MGLFDSFRKNNNGGTENHAVVDVDTNEDRLTPEELSRRSREIAVELEAEQKKAQEIYNQTQAMFAQYNKRMDEINNSSAAQNLRRDTAEYLDGIIGPSKLRPETVAAYEEAGRQLAELEAKQAVKEAEKAKRNAQSIEEEPKSVGSSPYYNNGSASASFLASSSETSQNGLVEMLEPGKITESGKNTSVSTQQIGQSSVGGISDQKELGKMVHESSEDVSVEDARAFLRSQLPF